MAYTGITTRAGKCAICKKPLPVGTLVYFDSSKSQGNHLAHKKCVDELDSTRRKYKWPGKEVLSNEPLDPPF